jgi:hypothetical protein
MQSGVQDHMNFGQGHGRGMFSTMPLMGHAMSGTQLGQADALIGKAQRAFADGGSVKDSKSAKPQISAKERKEIRDMIERGKSDAISTLRSTRSMLMSNAPAPSSEDEDDSSTAALANLSARLAMKDGGEVQADSPDELFAEYQKLTAELDNDEIEPSRQAEVVDRLAAITEELDKLGVPVGLPG